MASEKTRLSKNKYKSASQERVIIKDLREGKYMAIPVEKFAGNIFMIGDAIYEVQNNTSWKRITKNSEILESA